MRLVNSCHVLRDPSLDPHTWLVWTRLDGRESNRCTFSQDVSCKTFLALGSSCMLQCVQEQSERGRHQPTMISYPIDGHHFRWFFRLNPHPSGDRKGSRTILLDTIPFTSTACGCNRRKARPPKHHTYQHANPLYVDMQVIQHTRKAR